MSEATATEAGLTAYSFFPRPVNNKTMNIFEALRTSHDTQRSLADHLIKTSGDSKAALGIVAGAEGFKNVHRFIIHRTMQKAVGGQAGLNCGCR